MEPLYTDPKGRDLYTVLWYASPDYGVYATIANTVDFIADFDRIDGMHNPLNISMNRR